MPSVTSPSRRSTGHGGHGQRLHENPPRDTASQRHTHAMDGDQQRSVQRAASLQGHDVPRVDAETVQSPLQPVTAIDLYDAGAVTRLQLDESHDTKMIMILILNTSDEPMLDSPAKREHRA
jgi:hypothetical protein